MQELRHQKTKKKSFYSSYSSFYTAVVVVIVGEKCTTDKNRFGGAGDDGVGNATYSPTYLLWRNFDVCTKYKTT